MYGLLLWGVNLFFMFLLILIDWTSVSEMIHLQRIVWRIPKRALGILQGKRCKEHLQSLMKLHFLLAFILLIALIML